MADRKPTGYKDAYDKTIFEGDIIHDTYYDEDRNHYYEVVFRNGKFGMVKIYDSNNFTDFEDFTFTNEIIIGNKFDNPELLR